MISAPPAQLRVERVGARSVIGRSFATSPLRILTPRNHGDAAWVYTSTLGGGLVDGDRIRLEIEVGRGAAALVSTQGETRVYRSPRGCRSELSARLDSGAFLAVLPDPTVCFADAQYGQSTEVALAPDSALVLLEVLLSGRSARGERWAFRRYEAKLSLRIADRLILDETVLLDPTHGPIAERFGRFEVLATVVLAGQPLRARCKALRTHLDALPASPRADRIESANPLGDDALLIRVAGVSVEEVLRSVRTYLSFIPNLLGDDPWTRRN